MLCVIAEVISLLKTEFVISIDLFPDILITAIALIPPPVVIAQIVSSGLK